MPGKRLRTGLDDTTIRQHGGAASTVSSASSAPVLPMAMGLEQQLRSRHKARELQRFAMNNVFTDIEAIIQEDASTS